MKYEKNKIVYEIGDWVYVTERLADNCTKVGDVGLLTHLDISSNSPYCVNNSWCKDVRPATQQEIDDAIKEKSIMIGEYEVKFTREEGAYPHAIQVGCVTVSEEQFLEIGEKAGWI